MQLEGNSNLVRFEFPSNCTIYALNVNFIICLQGNKSCNNRHTSSTHIDLYDIPHIFYTRIIHPYCLRTLSGYYKYIYIYIYI